MAASIEKADGFAQVFPEHKFHIVDVPQQRGRQDSHAAEDWLQAEREIRET